MYTGVKWRRNGRLPSGETRFNPAQQADWLSPIWLPSATLPLNLPQKHVKSRLHSPVRPEDENPPQPKTGITDPSGTKKYLA